MTKTKKIWIGAGTLAGAAVLTIGGVTGAFASGSTDGNAQQSGGSAVGTTQGQAGGSPESRDAEKGNESTEGPDGKDDKDDKDMPLTGTTLTQASDAAVKAAGGGEVIESEVSDEAGSAYEVKVLTADGQEVEVQLDKSFAVVSQESEAAETGKEANEPAETGTEAGEPAPTDSGTSN